MGKHYPYNPETKGRGWDSCRRGSTVIGEVEEGILFGGLYFGIAQDGVRKADRGISEGYFAPGWERR